MEQNNDLALFEEAVQTAKDIASKYGVRLIIDNYEAVARNKEMMSLYGFTDVNPCAGGRFGLKIVSNAYRLTNTKIVDKTAVAPKYFMLLSNGNIGAHSICTDGDYKWVNETIYPKLKEYLNAMSYQYDPFNDYWMFVPSLDTAHRISELIKYAIHEYKEEKKVHERKRLLAELARLDGEND